MPNILNIAVTNADAYANCKSQSNLGLLKLTLKRQSLPISISFKKKTNGQ